MLIIERGNITVKERLSTGCILEYGLTAPQYDVFGAGIIGSLEILMTGRIRIYALIVLSGLALGSVGGCGGGSGGTSTPSGQNEDNNRDSSGINLAVSSVSPANGASQVDQGEAIDVRFNQPIRASSINGDSVVVSADGEFVDIEVTLGDSEETLSITPVEPLARGAQYEITLTTSIESTDGDGLDSDYRWSFQVLSGHWSPIAKVTRPSPYSFWCLSPYVAADGYFSAISHEREAGSNSYLHINRNEPPGEWQMLEALAHSDSDLFDCPAISFNAHNDGLAVWPVIWTRLNYAFYVNGSGWQAPALLAESEQAGNSIRRLAADHGPEGNAVAAWLETDESGEMVVRASYYTATATWESETLSQKRPLLSPPRVAIGPSGEAMAVWAYTENSVYYIVARHYSPLSGWSEQRVIGQSEFGPIADPQLAMDSTGRALVVWHGASAGKVRIFYSRFSSADQWSQPGQLESSEGLAHMYPKISMNAAGQAVVAWESVEDVETVNTSILAAYYSPEMGWGSPQLLEQKAKRAQDPAVAIDPQGNATVVWEQLVAPRGSEVHYSRYTNSGGWTGGSPIDPDSESPIDNIQLINREDGALLAIWETAVSGFAFSVFE